MISAVAEWRRRMCELQLRRRRKIPTLAPLLLPTANTNERKEEKRGRCRLSITADKKDCLPVWRAVYARDDHFTTVADCCMMVRDWERHEQERRWLAGRHRRPAPFFRTSPTIFPSIVSLSGVVVCTQHTRPFGAYLCTAIFFPDQHLSHRTVTLFYVCDFFDVSGARNEEWFKVQEFGPVFLLQMEGRERVERVRFFFLHFRLYGHDRLTYGQTVWGLFFCEFAPDPQDWDRNTPKVTTEREDRSRWANKLTIIKANNIQAFARGGTHSLLVQMN